MYKVRVPANLVLMGEHAVLANQAAIGMAIARYLSVTWQARNDNLIKINSALQNFTGNLTALLAEPKLKFVAAAIQSMPSAHKGGFELSIEADFASDIGFGSSACVLIGTVAVLHYSSTKQTMPALDLFKHCLKVCRAVQGMGSGLDLATSIYGSCVLYQQEPLSIEVIKVASNLPNLSASYCGYKIATPKVLALLKIKHQDNQAFLDKLYSLMGDLSQLAAEHLQSGNWSALGFCMNAQHGLLNALGVSNLDLETLVAKAHNAPNNLGAKISGSGLGDCIIALSKSPILAQQSPELIELNLAKEGLRYE